MTNRPMRHRFLLYVVDRYRYTICKISNARRKNPFLFYKRKEECNSYMCMYPMYVKDVKYNANDCRLKLYD